MDGKTLRGSASDGQAGDHLLAALHHVHGAVLGQVEVGAKTNEIPRFSVLLERMDIAGTVITVDALCRYRHKAPLGSPFSRSKLRPWLRSVAGCTTRAR